MKAKNTLLMFASALLSTATSAQVSGNYNYRAAGNQILQNSINLPSASSMVSLQPVDYQYYSVKGLMNCEADSYLAIFTITQLGTTQTETEALVRAKTDSIKRALQAQGVEVETYVDMISFVPIYEVEVTKKLFSEDTYNEVPKGFELKKNLHFRYSDPEVLENLVTLCAEQEIYDLVRVDYFIDDLEAKKAEMIAKAETILTAEVERYQRFVGADLSESNVQFGDAFRMSYPIERYQTYTAYSSSALNVRNENGTVVQENHTTSEFYMPQVAKGYDFVLNPSILEPVVQIEYEIALRYSPKPIEEREPEVITETEIHKEVILITPEGQVKPIRIE